MTPTECREQNWMRLNRVRGGWLAWADYRVNFRRSPFERGFALIIGRRYVGAYRSLREAMVVARKHWRPNFAMYADATLRRQGGAKRHPEAAAIIAALVETQDPVALLQLADWLIDQGDDRGAQHTLRLGKLAGIRAR